MENNNLLEKSESARPLGLPEKFWDEEKQAVKLEELLADYLSLVKRDDNLVEQNNRGIPESFEKYEIKIPHPLLDRDDDVLKRLHENGFTNAQAQLVYDLAGERVIPCLDNMTVDFEAQKQLEKLQNHFGGTEKFNEVSRQISNWAKTNLKPEVYDALATTADGVVALYKMMSSNEPMLGKDVELGEELSEQGLRKMMEDPRYWRDKDEAYIAKVTSGFKKLYPGQKQ